MDDNKAIVKKADLKSLLNNPAIKSRFESVLGKNAGAFIAAVLNTAVSNPDIANCDPLSVINSALQAAVLGLSISSALGQAAIVPFNSKTGKKAQFILMKNGLIQMALRTNQYRYIHVGKIYEGETWEEDRFTGKMSFKGGRTGDKIIGLVAYFQLLSGFEKYLVMSIDELIAHGKQYSKSYDRKNDSFYPGSFWHDNPMKACEKTIIKLLVKNYGVLSDKIEHALEIENETGEEAITGEVIEAEPVTEPVSTTNNPAAPLPEDEKSPDQILMELGYS